ncbi:MAG: hypothetical protein NTV95_01590 [Candidatus Saccharibacteria bacterium]|nr:hypothetical protein [Candidatus Saccharibacteria bacterium]
MSLINSSLGVETGYLPHHQESDLREMHAQGFMRYGVVAMVLDDQNRLLLLEHAASDKTEEGMWGALGETSHAFKNNGTWEVEPVGTTVIRGLREETNADLKPEDFDTPVFGNCIDTSWPIGSRFLDQYAYASVPLLFAGPETVEKIMDAPVNNEEIRSKRMVTLDRVLNYELRKGTIAWLAIGATALSTASNDTVPLQSQPWTPNGSIQDAVLSELFR